MLTETLITIASTAAVTSLPWFIAYRSHTGYLDEKLSDACRDYSELFADLDDALTKLAAEKVETENFAATNEMLRNANIRLMGENYALKQFKAKRNMSKRQRASAKAAAVRGRVMSEAA